MRGREKAEGEGKGLVLLKGWEAKITNKTEKQRGDGGRGGKTERRKICCAEGKVGGNGGESRACARSAAPLAVTGAFLSSLVICLPFFLFPPRSCGTGSLPLFFFSFFPFFSPIPSSPSLCLYGFQQKADRVSLTSEWVAHTCCEGKRRAERGSRRREKGASDPAEEEDKCRSEAWSLYFLFFFSFLLPLEIKGVESTIFLLHRRGGGSDHRHSPVLPLTHCPLVPPSILFSTQEFQASEKWNFSGRGNAGGQIWKRGGGGGRQNKGREAGGGEDNPRAYSVRIHQRPLPLLIFFFFFFIGSVTSAFPLPCAAPDSNNVETAFPRQGYIFQAMHVCTLIIIKQNLLCVYIYVGESWKRREGVALGLTRLLCFCNGVCHESSMRAREGRRPCGGPCVCSRRAPRRSSRDQMGCHFWSQRSQGIGHMRGWPRHAV